MDNLADPSVKGLILMSAWLEENLYPAKYIDDRYPVLRRIPDHLAPWRRIYKREREVLDTIARAWWDPAKANVERGKEVQCFATNIIKTYPSEGWTEDEAAMITLSLMLAGSGTTAATLNYTTMGLALFPEVLKKAHEELDRVVGPNRLPVLEDEQNLPYLRALIKESYRWRPFSNAGM